MVCISKFDLTQHFKINLMTIKVTLYHQKIIIKSTMRDKHLKRKESIQMILDIYYG